MKNKALLSLAVLSIVFFSSCEDDDKIQPSDVSGTVVNGQWRIAYFLHAGTEETSSFVTYNFTFTATPDTSPATGLVEATNGNTDVVGSWATGFIGDNAKLKLNFALSPFNNLNDDWEVTELNSTTIKLKHNGNDTYLLTLEMAQ
jgi:hypothetical protein